MPERFDVVEYRAARTLSEADYFWKRKLARIPASRLDLPPDGVMPRLRRMVDRLLMKEGIL